MELTQKLISNDTPVMLSDGVNLKGMSRDCNIVATKYNPNPFPPVARSRP